MSVDVALVCYASVVDTYLPRQHITGCNLNRIPRIHLLLSPLRSCLIKDFELRPNVLDLFQHAFIKQTVGKEKILQKQLIELIDLNQQIGVIEKTRYSLKSHLYVFVISQKLSNSFRPFLKPEAKHCGGCIIEQTQTIRSHNFPYMSSVAVLIGAI